MTSSRRIGASFRDPSGFLFSRGGILFRQVNHNYRPSYDLLVSSGLQEELVEGGWLIPHEVVKEPPADETLASLVLRPEPIAFVSYPYEWCFSQLKDAALLTLAIQERALGRGLTLKDSSAYNIQFHQGRPVLIDSLSFEPWTEGEPWVAYRQFCRHFLAPLALMARVDIRIGDLLRIHIDGLPLDLTSHLLPGKTRLQPGLLAHIHLHAASQRRYAGTAPEAASKSRMSLNAMRGLVDSLKSTVGGLDWAPGGTDWADYEQEHNYSAAALESKRRLVAGYIDRIRPKSTWDLGANVGTFSRLAAEAGSTTIAFDLDPSAVEVHYRRCRERGEKNVLPLRLDLSNPSPAQGWAHGERMSLAERGPADVVMALALIHHLAIANNVPLSMVAETLASYGRWLILEFVPKSDSQVQRLLSSRKDIFTDYTLEGVQEAFRRSHSIRAMDRVKDSERVLFLMEKRQET
ncbi:MAG TPA: hypothetical protein VFI11_03600 [Anaerolineales bacterium]|nr:hypothetical protein [Anaerolineales bacterium]